MKRKLNNKFLIWLFFPVFVLACVLPSASTPLATPVIQTFDSNSVGTVIAQTISAAQTSTVIHLPSLTSTLTSLPTATSTPTTLATATDQFSTFGPTYTLGVPTLTQVPLSTSTSTRQSIGQVVSSPDGTLSESDQRATKYPKIPKEWNCTITEKTPPKGILVDPKSSFYVSWTIVNNGTKIWTGNTIDFVFTGGYVSEGKLIQDFP